MDGVIFDTERMYRRAWLETARAYNISGVESIIPKMMGASSAAIEKLFAQSYGRDFPFDKYHKNAKEKLASIIEDEGIILKKGVREIFELLAENKIPTALATATRRVTAEKYLADKDLLKYFDATVTGDDISHGKPDPEIYLKACSALGVLPQDAIAIEDSYNGIRSAHSAGMMPVMVPDTVMPDAEIEKLLYRRFDSLLDTAAFIDKMYRQ